MRKSLLLAVTTASLMAGSIGIAGDGLLSEIRLDSTVAPTKTSRPAQTSTPRSEGKSVGGAGSLQSLLLAAGYSTKVTDLNEVTTSITRSDWTADVTISLANDASQLRLAVQLPTTGEDVEVSPKTLRELLDANRKQGNMAFALAADTQRIELLRSIRNESLTSSRLREDLEAMADYADKTTRIWDLSVANTSAPTTTPVPEAPAPVTTPAQPTKPQTLEAPQATAPAVTATLTGKWIASATKNEAFALQLDADGSFRLVHVKGNKPTRSQGTYQFTSNTLTLKGNDGSTLAGTVTKQTDGFSFGLKGAGGKTVTLNFKSSS